MDTSNIPGGTLQITLTNAFQYLVMGLFYVIVTKTNALTQTDVGRLSILTFLASAFSLLTGLALPTALTKFASERRGRNQHEEAGAVQRTVVRTVLSLSIAGFVIASVLSQTLSQYFWNNSEYALLIILMLIYAFLFNMITLCNSILQALYLFGGIATVSIIFVISSRITAIALAIRIGLQGVLIGYITGCAIALVPAIIILRGKLPKTVGNMSLKPLLYFSVPLFLGSLALFALNWLDVVIVASLTLDYSLTGVYYIVNNSVGVLSMLWIPATTTMFPALSAYYGRKNLVGIRNILKNASRYIAYIIFPSCLGLAIIAPTALTFFYGSDYTKGAVPLAILSMGAIIVALYSLFTTTLTAIGKTGQILRINTISVGSAILMLLVLVPLFQTTGAAIARLATEAITLMLATYTLHREIRIQLDKEALWKSAVASASTVPFLLLLELAWKVNLSTIRALAVEVLGAAAIYVLSLYILKALKKQDIELLRRALPKPVAKYLKILEHIMVR